MFKKFLLGAAFALSATAASAVTVTTSGFMGGAAPVESGTVGISIGNIFTVDVFASAADVGSGPGSLTYGFTASNELVALETNTLNDLLGFLNPSVVWSTGMGGTGTVRASLLGNAAVASALAGNPLEVLFGAAETLWLTMSWDDVVEAASDFDVRITAAAVPLPAGVLLMGTALAGFGVASRRKRK